MAITDPKAIRYSNEWTRPMADQIAKLYYQCAALNDLWESLGGTNDDKIALPAVAADVYAHGQRATFTVKRLKEGHLRWAAESIGVVITNTADEIWDDPAGGQQDPTRPPLLGSDAFAVKQVTEKLLNWFEANQFLVDASVTNARDFDNWSMYLRVNNDRSTETVIGTWGWKIAKDLADPLRANFEGANSGNLTNVLKAAVNPDLTE